jgi:hypothetical protein
MIVKTILHRLFAATGRVIRMAPAAIFAIAVDHAVHGYMKMAVALTALAIVWLAVIEKKG